MPVVVQCDVFSLVDNDVEKLWSETIKFSGHSDDEVTVRCVDEKEITELNTRYRGCVNKCPDLFISGDGCRATGPT
jgi:ssRNA-specific RNase YbeY (16S rRNA maturation enzyme)